jgi:cyanophycinase-like exopeptidase
VGKRLRTSWVEFAKRDRLGRSLVFLARLVQDGWSTKPREIAVDEKNAVLVEADGQSRIVGPVRERTFSRFRRRHRPAAPAVRSPSATLRSITVLRDRILI